MPEWPEWRTVDKIPGHKVWGPKIARVIDSHFQSHPGQAAHVLSLLGASGIDPDEFDKMLTILLKFDKMAKV